MSMIGEFLEVTVVKAWDLRDAKQFQWGEQDPYAVVTYNQFNFRTRTIEDGGKQAVWNETFSFPLESNPEVTITVLHDRKKNDDLLGVTKIPWSLALEHGYFQGPVQLYTLGEMKPKGKVEVVIKFPSIIKRIQQEMAAEEAARRMEALMLAQAKAAYDQALADAITKRMEKAKQKLGEQVEVLKETLATVWGHDAFPEHEAALLKAKEAFAAAYGEASAHLIQRLDFDNAIFDEKFRKDVHDDEKFLSQIETFENKVATAKGERVDGVAKAKAKYDVAISEATKEYLEDLIKVSGAFQDVAVAAAKSYRSEVGSIIHSAQEAKALEDVAALKPKEP